MHCWFFHTDNALRGRTRKDKSVFDKEAVVKYERLWRALVFSLIVALTSCGNENETITGHNPTPNPNTGITGLVGTFSGTVQNTDHTKSGTLTIAIRAYDSSSGLLTGTLKLTGFSECFTTGIFPDPNHKNYDNYYLPGRGFGFIQASGTQPGSYSYLPFEGSTYFYNGLQLGGVAENLGFRDASHWCLSIDSALLKRK